MMDRRRGFTLVELLVAIVVIAVLLVLVAPAFQQFIVEQRMKGINAQLVTDLQMARAEAVSRGTIGRVVFGSNSAMTCYSIFVIVPGGNIVRCDCTLGPGSACSGAGVAASAREVKTVQVPASQGVSLQLPANVDPAIGFDPVNGSLVTIPTDVASSQAPPFTVDTAIDSAHLIRAVLSKAGRPTLCSIGGSYGPPTC